MTKKDMSPEAGSPKVERRGRPRKKAGDAKLKKAPQAPKRFKSSYICFSVAKQDEAKEELGPHPRVADVAKRIAEKWKNLNEEERQVWADVAQADKDRYMAEKASYTGPWQIPTKRSKKDPTAPKRPMSSFLHFSKKYRSILKSENPEMKNTDISKKLGEMWKSAPEEERNDYIAREAKERGEYKVAIAEWREKHAKDAAENEDNYDLETDPKKRGRGRPRKVKSPTPFDGQPSPPTSHEHYPGMMGPGGYPPYSYQPPPQERNDYPPQRGDYPPHDYPHRSEYATSQGHYADYPPQSYYQGGGYAPPGYGPPPSSAGYGASYGAPYGASYGSNYGGEQDQRYPPSSQYQQPGYAPSSGEYDSYGGAGGSSRTAEGGSQASQSAGGQQSPYSGYGGGYGGQPGYEGSQGGYPSYGGAYPASVGSGGQGY
uniref:HMG box domain-containing protein n=1 Tax=Helicotheca tamesis TaxID=374047 RepID=A0A7S2HFZ5_9STRA|mmetsp:Transcript_17789/g.24509  ORF Transcript_17789/g.24509 Transcript_17789/m.24509 type:complete len:429 (+) Transcript_17789:499-1785(+)|eukprot:CAMPEP_0185723100 /NCGR_PEP_ID=MMETSP1171-20130828/42_1 /TAXON_ID=374046 /ORGANISM="Helicotheca tamensis, Strain CCMP826" /LENGTH=428 /DNA_ID=CAMNT_0028390763 /DNA_START=125 /DNA_END=1411 /DNA_ORIENTATION=-